MRRFTKTLFLFGLGVAAGASLHKNKAKVKKELNRLVKQGKIKAKEGKAIAADLMKDAKAKAKEKQKEYEKAARAETKEMAEAKKRKATYE